MQIEYDNLNVTDYAFNPLTFEWKLVNNEKGKNNMEQIINTPTMELAMSVEETAEKLEVLAKELAGRIVTSDEADPTDAERVIH